MITSSRYSPSRTAAIRRSRKVASRLRHRGSAPSAIVLAFGAIGAMRWRRMLEALIFDVDGTLADTERDGHRVAYNAAFTEAGLDWDWTASLYGELLAVTGGK